MIQEWMAEKSHELEKLMMEKPTADELSLWLAGPLEDALTSRYGKLHATSLSRGDMVADGTTVLLLSDSSTRAQAVVLCSAPIAPDMVQRAMHRAHQAKMAMGERDGAFILDALAEGRVHGLSYAVLPYCNSLSKLRAIRWVQRSLLRPLVFEWLMRMTQCTVKGIEPSAIGTDFAEPLRCLVSLEGISVRLRAATEHAAARLGSGAWLPKHVLMHGDLWQGNILIRTAGRSAQRWRDRVVITDWGGSKIDGHAIYDLIRLAQSMRLPVKDLRRELVRHCRVLKCELADSRSHLLAALGCIRMSLEHFPMDRYMYMAESCLATLDHALE
jgi:hypothetical protein